MQSVLLFGGGSDRFKSVTTALDLLLKYLSKRLSVVTDTVLSKRYEVENVVRASRHWLSYVDYDNPIAPVFDKNVEPSRILENMIGKGLAYTAANVVSYSETIAFEEGKVTL